MSLSAESHGREHSDQVLLYALQALPASEVPAVEERLASCAGCRREIDTLRPVVDAFAAWPTDVLRPSRPLWGRLAERIAVEAGRDRAASPPTESVEPASAWAEPEWADVAPGISVKLLASDDERGRVSMLVRLAPGVDYPPHRHAGVEELHLLDGELMIDDRKLHPGGYSRAEPGSADRRVWSETGCTCVLVTSPHDELG
ncbi:MAG: cupin domain-containing protein [Thermodesulfobacteriota bacterium]